MLPMRGRRYGRGRGRAFSLSSPPLRPVSDPRLMEGLKSSALQDIQIPDALPEPRGIEPRELKPLASYNWTNEGSPTIIVPGCPPIWQNKPTPFKIPRDTGVSFIDQNRHRVPRYPLLPLVAAVDHMIPDFDFSSIDIVTDRNNLRKLLRWVEGSIKRDFRIDVQLAGASTVLFVRRDSEPVEFDSGRLGYGQNFEQYTTRLLADCENSTGHHRIIAYDYGGLKLLLRFEVDACLHYDARTQRADRPAARRPNLMDPEDQLLLALGSLSVSTDDKVNIVSAGELVAQSTLVEMTTRNEEHLGAGIDWQEYFPQLFLSQTPHHYLGVHNSGQFRRVETHTLKDDVLASQQRTQQASFDKLRLLLEDIREMVISRGDSARLSLVYRVETKKLRVYERLLPASALPDLWMRRFDVPLPATPKEVDNINGAGNENESWHVVETAPDDGVDSQQDLFGSDSESDAASTSTSDATSLVHASARRD